MVLIFAMSALLFFQSQSDAGSLSSFLEASRACHEIAAQITAVDAAGNGTVAALRFPESVGGNYSYEVFVAGANRSLAVKYGAQGTGCPLPVASITNGTGAAFYMNISNSTARNNGAGVVVG